MMKHSRRNRRGLLAAAILCAGPGILPAGAIEDPTPRIVWAPPGGGALPADLAAALDTLLEISLESTAMARRGGQARGEAAGLDLEIQVSGKGPWKIVVVGEHGPDNPGRFRTSEVPFDGRDTLTGAIDRLGSEIVSGWNETAKVDLPPPVPIARALSDSGSAVDRYIDALRSIGQGDMVAAESGLRAALDDDPTFALAAAELAFSMMTAGDSRSASIPLANDLRMDAPLALFAASGMRLALEGRGSANRLARQIERGRGLKWIHAVRGLTSLASGAREAAVDAWVRAVFASPEDPRAHYWLGVAHMGAGQFDLAAVAFRESLETWPALLPARVLLAESLARDRDTDAARAVLEAYREWISAHGVPVSGDTTNPDLMLGSVDMLEGRFEAALKRFETSLDLLEEAGAGIDATGSLHRIVVRMRRDLMTDTKSPRRERELRQAGEAVDRYERALFSGELTAEEERRRRDECLMLRTLITVRTGDTLEAWKVVRGMKESSEAASGEPKYEALLLEGATMLKEGDYSGAILRNGEAARIGGRSVDTIVTGRIQRIARHHDAARETFRRVEITLRHYAPAWPPDASFPGELILTDPYLASMVPVYHYERARLAYLSGDAAESRYHFNRLLRYYRSPDSRVSGMVKEAISRGATPE